MHLLRRMLEGDPVRLQNGLFTRLQEILSFPSRAYSHVAYLSVQRQLAF